MKRHLLHLLVNCLCTAAEAAVLIVVTQIAMTSLPCVKPTPLDWKELN